MVFERKVNTGKGEYWILVHSVRKGKKVTQRSRYLGKALPSKLRLERLKKEFLMELRGERFKYLTDEDVGRIEEKRKRYQRDMKKLSFSERKNLEREFIVRFTYDSSKLSGVDVTLRQTLLILKDGVIPRNFKNLRTAKELENHEKGVMAITKYRGQLNLRFIEKIHKILFLGVEDSIAGKLRSELKRDVKIAGTIYVPPKWIRLEKELDNFFKWYKSEQRRMHPLELAALVHLRIISIQPFVDGNSRLSRLLMNWILWKKGYPMIDIPVEDLEVYYDVLDKYQIERKEKPFVDYLKGKFLEG